MKCPRCGSKNVAEILYGMPAFDDELEARIESGKVRLGGCCVTDHDPRFHCNKCHSDFGYPPTITTKTGSEDLRDAITSIYFSVGGYFEGHKEIWFKKSGDTVSYSLTSFPNYAEANNVVISKREWQALLDKLFCKLCVHEWKKRYDDPCVLDGEQWKLQFKLTRGRQRTYHGSNAYPPLWAELQRVFQPYFKKYREVQD